MPIGVYVHQRGYLRPRLSTVLDRFFLKVSPEPNTGCWLWMGAIAKNGYGNFTDSGRTVYAHRFSYELENGPIADGLHLDHICRMRCCVNPRHLRAVTCRENVLDRNATGFSARNYAKTNCPNGHPYDEQNTYIRPKGWRDCRICAASRKKAYMLRSAPRQS